MVVEVAVLADYANMAENGKLNVMGMFDRIWAQTFPAAHAYMVLALRIRIDFEDRNRNHQLAIALFDEDGAQLGGGGGELQVGAIPAGQREVISQILAFPGIVFPRAGEYAFVISWDGAEKAKVPLTLAVPTPPSAGA